MQLWLLGFKVVMNVVENVGVGLIYLDVLNFWTWA